MRRCLRHSKGSVLIYNSIQIATEVQGTFRISGSAKRMRDLQAEFEKPPRVCSVVRFTVRY